MARTLNIVGGGNVGKALGHLWASGQAFLIQDILNRSIESGQRAVTFIGAGRAVTDYAEMRRAKVYMLSVPDDRIGDCCEKLVRAGHLSAETVVFHCSGALASSEMRPALQQGAAVASVHPVRSFAEPERIVKHFAGTFCGMEGDARALQVLEQAFSEVGAELFRINADAKILYHAGSVFACNYLVTLLDIALQAYAAAGITEDTARKLMAPLVQETVQNVIRRGPAAALTGPIARGDIATAVRQYRAVSAWRKSYGALYKQLGKLTADLAERKK